MIFDLHSSIGSVAESVLRFSDTDGNVIYPLYKINAFFADAQHGDYRIRDLQKLRDKIPDFPQIPLDQIGRTAS